jgi:hypothetical protein
MPLPGASHAQGMGCHGSLFPEGKSHPASINEIGVLVQGLACLLVSGPNGFSEFILPFPRKVF